MVGVLASVNDGKVTLLAVCGKDAVAKGVKAGDIIKAIAPIVGGRGGGKPNFVQGSVAAARGEIERFFAE